MQPKISNSPILMDYHDNVLKEHKLLLKVLLGEELAQKRLREKYARTPVTKKKMRARIKSKIVPRKKGKQRTCFEYAVARQIVRSEGISSGIQYARWFQMNQPKRMPKRPDRAYKAQWKGWGDFLGVYNTFTGRPGDKTNGRWKYRSFKEARAFALSLNFERRQDWFDYARSGLCPSDIPHRPDIVYGKDSKRKDYWLSWKDFLGYGLKSPIDKISDAIPVIYFAKRRGGVNNVYIVNVIPGGKAGLEDHLPKINATLICAYYVDLKFDHNSKIISTLSQYPYGMIDEYIVPNIYDIMDLLGDNLERVV